MKIINNVDKIIEEKTLDMKTPQSIICNRFMLFL